MVEQLVAPEQQGRYAFTNLRCRLVDAQLVHRQRFLRPTLAIESSVDRCVFANLVHAPWIAFVHDEDLFEFFGGALLRVVGLRFEWRQTAGISVRKCAIL